MVIDSSLDTISAYKRFHSSALCSDSKRNLSLICFLLFFMAPKSSLQHLLRSHNNSWMGSLPQRYEPQFSKATPLNLPILINTTSSLCSLSLRGGSVEQRATSCNYFLCHDVVTFCLLSPMQLISHFNKQTSVSSLCEITEFLLYFSRCISCLSRFLFYFLGPNKCFTFIKSNIDLVPSFLLISMAIQCLLQGELWFVCLFF